MCSESCLRVSMGYEIGNEKGWRGVVGVGTGTETAWDCQQMSSRSC
jgi:hypothetical protein